MITETPDSNVLLEEQTEKDLIPMYEIIMWDDDRTTMDFVVNVLTELFDKTNDEATGLMMEIHNNGNGIVALIPLEPAEFKVDQLNTRAKASGFPFSSLIVTWKPYLHPRTVETIIGLWIKNKKMKLEIKSAELKVKNSELEKNLRINQTNFIQTHLSESHSPKLLME